MFDHHLHHLSSLGGVEGAILFDIVEDEPEENHGDEQEGELHRCPEGVVISDNGIVVVLDHIFR